MLVKHRFKLSDETKEYLHSLKVKFGFDGFGEATYYRTYSRLRSDGGQECWADTIIRVVEGVMSIRKNHYLNNGLGFVDSEKQSFARALATSMFRMEFLPPGRGLYSMGTEMVYKKGSMALNNCGAVDTTDLSDAVDWLCDGLMCGVGVGFNLAWRGEVNPVDKTKPIDFVIPDSREGWVESVRLLIESYTKHGDWYKFDYSAIRPYGAPIKGFGGIASGPQPLIDCHISIEKSLDDYSTGKYDASRTTADICNKVGVMIISGGVRRSAEICLGSPDDETFLNLKNYEINPERMNYGWTSNNTAILSKPEHFEGLDKIAKRIVDNGEPGICNLINMQKYGRYGQEMPDKATLCNPCGEIGLENKELCNLAEVFPTRCESEEIFYKAIEFATYYSSTVALLPCHRAETNAVIARNRRIGVSLSGIADYLVTISAAELTKRLRKGYKLVRRINAQLAAEAGVPASIRVTTVKPSGTISLLSGNSSGLHYPTFKYAIRRMRVAQNSPICKVLMDAGVPNEPDVVSTNTQVFEFPIDQGDTRQASDVSAWEQFALLAQLQREWSDNMVSCTVYFDKVKEGPQVERMLAQFAPLIKSVSMLPHSDEGEYPQMPYSRIDKAEYDKRKKALGHIDWSSFTGSDGYESRFCSNDSCEI
jgi:ribonucleoside-diphosphate reductase alpha chain